MTCKKCGTNVAKKQAASSGVPTGVLNPSGGRQKCHNCGGWLNREGICNNTMRCRVVTKYSLPPIKHGWCTPRWRVSSGLMEDRSAVEVLTELSKESPAIKHIPGDVHQVLRQMNVPAYHLIWVGQDRDTVKSLYGDEDEDVCITAQITLPPGSVVISSHDGEQLVWVGPCYATPHEVSQADIDDYGYAVQSMLQLQGNIATEPEWDPDRCDTHELAACAEAVRQGKELYHEISPGDVSNRHDPMPPEKRELWYSNGRFQVGDVAYVLEGEYTTQTLYQPAEYPYWVENDYNEVRYYDSYEAAARDLLGGRST